MSRGRPPKLTPDVELTVCEGISVGMPPELACERAGITRRSLSNWQKWGQEEIEQLADGEQPQPGSYAHLFLRLKIALGECAYSQLQTISEARTDKTINWQAAAWIAERRWPEFFARKTVIEVGGERGNVDLLSMSPEQLSEIARGGR